MTEQDPTLEPSPNSPSPPSTEKLASLASEVLKKQVKWSGYQKPHHGEWFVNAAMLRNNQHATYDEINAQLIIPEQPSYAVKIDFNKILPKHRARMAKFFKTRPKPVVVPASTEYVDLMDARATERVLQYQWERLRLESAYRDARQWAAVGSKAYWWIGFDPTVKGRVQMVDDLTGEKYSEEAELGDVVVEGGNVWEVLVPDPTIARIGQQSEILRVRTMPRGEAERRFPVLKKPDVREQGGTAASTELKQTEDRIAALTSTEQGLGSTTERDNHVMLMEHYMAPCGKYPKGRKVVVCAGKVVRYDEELPFEFWQSPTNPYPCVEFSDTGNVGQFWNTTWIAQLVPLQRTLNRLLELVMENLEAVSRPKIIVYKQHNLPEGAWTNAAGEIVELNWVPGLPEPRIVQPNGVAGEIWNFINLVLRQFDDISQIHTASEGGGGGQESGYQTNLLQEATDAVHAPDIRGDELAIEDAAWKMRRIMKLTWDVPRLISVGGEGSAAEMFEFSNAQINDAAEVRMQSGSMMPELKAAKAQTMMNLFEKGLLGDPNDPIVKRKALSMIDIVGTDVVHDEDRLDEDEAMREGHTIMQGGVVPPATAFQNHMIHLPKHEARMKTPEWQALDDDAKLAYIAHVITHYDFVNLPLAMGLRSQYGIDIPVATPPMEPAPPAAPAVAPSGAPAEPTPQPVA